jgi:mitochondrial chaperone BCS1
MSHFAAMMDFATLFRNNMTNLSSGSIPGEKSPLMESLMPFLGGQISPLLRTAIFINQMIGSHLGLDPTMILTMFGFAWAIHRLGRQAYMTIYGIIKQNFMSSIHISSGDDIYTHMMKWLAVQPKMKNSTSLTAETTSKTAWEEEEEQLETLRVDSVADMDGTKYLNFSNQAARAPPRFVPAIGVHGFWYNGRYFRLHRKQQSFFDESGWQTFKEKEDLVISCFGRSPEPIKNLIQHAKEFYYQDHYARTTIKRPSPQSLRRYGGRYFWTEVANRPVRPMKTVVLDRKQKKQVLADMNEYLHPATPRWYANRGIPLRRGYLFHGPPGTGKTSLSFALAGVFGLDIYVISLLDPSLAEEDLIALFNNLPRRCVVLLEDIDTAGLSRPQDEETPSEDTKDGKKEKKGISLSGLLNAIDGVASHEGRVLIMTTNRPESLDEALIRPGRVDLQVGFTNATREQATELFQRMYEAEINAFSSIAKGSVPPVAVKEQEQEEGSPLIEEKRIAMEREPKDGAFSIVNLPTPPDTPGPEQTRHRTLQEPSSEDILTEPSNILVRNSTFGDEAEAQVASITPEELEGIAKQFGDKIPQGEFSPAEIQGFLLKRKKDPRKALQETASWAAALIAQKASKTKVSKIQ